MRLQLLADQASFKLPGRPSHALTQTCWAQVSPVHSNFPGAGASKMPNPHKLPDQTPATNPAQPSQTALLQTSGAERTVPGGKASTFPAALLAEADKATNAAAAAAAAESQSSSSAAGLAASQPRTVVSPLNASSSAAVGSQAAAEEAASANRQAAGAAAAGSEALAELDLPAGSFPAAAARDPGPLGLDSGTADSAAGTSGQNLASSAGSSAAGLQDQNLTSLVEALTAETAAGVSGGGPGKPEIAGYAGVLSQEQGGSSRVRRKTRFRHGSNSLKVAPGQALSSSSSSSDLGQLAQQEGGADGGPGGVSGASQGIPQEVALELARGNELASRAAAASEAAQGALQASQGAEEPLAPPGESEGPSALTHVVSCSWLSCQAADSQAVCSRPRK